MDALRWRMCLQCTNRQKKARGSKFQDEDQTMILQSARGNYSFLKGGPAFSGAVVADEGYSIVHVTLLNPPPVTDGFDFIAGYLKAQGRPAQAVCSIELRSPRRLSATEFAEFNNGKYLPALK